MGQTSRSRWAAIGAAIAVTLGAGGLVGVNAAGSASTLVPIDPVRILDTRSGDRVGSLDVAGASEPYRLKIAGVSGIPSAGVTGVSLNVTAVDTQSNDYGGFVTVYPCATASSARPDVSNLNFRSAQTLANSVTVPVSANGYICFYVYGTAHLLADANGYYTENTAGATIDAYTKAETNNLLSGKAEPDSLEFQQALVERFGDDIRIETVGDDSIFNLPDVAVSSSGNPVIASTYLPDGAGILEPSIQLTICSDPICFSAPTIIYPISGTAAYHHLELTRDNRPVISYIDGGGVAKLLICGNSTCSSANTTITLSNTGEWPDLAIDREDRPVIVLDTAANDLVVITCDDQTCSGKQENRVATDVKQSPAVAIGLDNKPVISYPKTGSKEIKLVICNDRRCDGNNEEIVSISADSDGKFTAVDVTSDGLPAVAFFTPNSSFFVSICDDPLCATRVNKNVGTRGQAPRLEFDSNDIAHIALVHLREDYRIDNSGDPADAVANADVDDLLEGFAAVWRCTDKACSYLASEPMVEPQLTVGPSIAISPSGIMYVTYTNWQSTDTRLLMIPAY